MSVEIRGKNASLVVLKATSVASAFPNLETRSSCVRIGLTELQFGVRSKVKLRTQQIPTIAAFVRLRRPSVDRT